MTKYIVTDGKRKIIANCWEDAISICEEWFREDIGGNYPDFYTEASNLEQLNADIRRWLDFIAGFLIANGWKHDVANIYRKGNLSTHLDLEVQIYCE